MRDPTAEHFRDLTPLRLSGTNIAGLENGSVGSFRGSLTWVDKGN